MPHNLASPTFSGQRFRSGSSGPWRTWAAQPPRALRGVGVHRGGPCATPAITGVTTLRTAPSSGGVPSRPAKSRCPVPISVSASVSRVGVRRDAAQFAFGGEVGGEHGRGFREDGDAGRSGLAQPGAQAVPEGDEADDRHGDRPEQLHQRAGEVVRDGAGPGAAAQGGGPGAGRARRRRTAARTRRAWPPLSAPCFPARQFQAAGCGVLGVEPDARIADLARRLGVDVDTATVAVFNDGGDARCRVDAVAWHPPGTGTVGVRPTGSGPVRACGHGVTWMLVSPLVSPVTVFDE